MKYVSHVVDQLLHDQHGGTRSPEILVSRLSLDQNRHCRTIGRVLLNRDARRQRPLVILRVINDGLLRVGVGYVDDGLLVQRIALMLLMMVLMVLLLLLLVLLLLVMVIIGRREIVHAHRLHGGQHHGRRTLRRHVLHGRRRHDGLRVCRRHARRFFFTLHYHLWRAAGQRLLLLLSFHRGRHGYVLQMVATLERTSLLALLYSPHSLYTPPSLYTVRYLHWCHACSWFSVQFAWPK